MVLSSYSDQAQQPSVPKPASLSEPEPLPGNAKVGLHIELTFDGKTRLDVFDRDEIFIGRKHPEADISLDLSGDLLVSRTHARIWQTRGICWVQDLSSTHGTLVNGESIEGACVVNTADKVQIGSTLIRVWHVAPTDMTQGDDAAVVAGDKEAPLTERQPDRGGSGFPELDSYPVYKEEDYRYYPPGERSAPEVEAVMKSRAAGSPFRSRGAIAAQCRPSGWRKSKRAGFMCLRKFR